jgi:hypothetical protein
MPQVDLRAELERELLRHPRVVHQELLADAEGRGRLAASLPTFVPFRATGYAAAAWVLDWDHRLPSRDLILRLYAFYTEDSLRAFRKAFEDRRKFIEKEDLFPEFDVPDFGGLVADEAYEAEVPVAGPPKKFRLVSEWRREVEAKVGRAAEDVVRQSSAFKELSSQVRARPPGLGDLEAAEWSPPSESGHGRWGIDVWYLRAFNGMVGEGTAFLVDLEEQRVVSQRDFQFRAG